MVFLASILHVGEILLTSTTPVAQTHTRVERNMTWEHDLVFVFTYWFRLTQNILSAVKCSKVLSRTYISTAICSGEPPQVKIRDMALRRMRYEKCINTFSFCTCTVFVNSNCGNKNAHTRYCATFFLIKWPLCFTLFLRF